MFTGFWVLPAGVLLRNLAKNSYKEPSRAGVAESEGEKKSHEAYSELIENGWIKWNWDKEIFSDCKFLFSIVKVVSNGIIRQDEYGLVDEDSSYEGAEYIGVC